MTLEDIGYSIELEDFRKTQGLDSFQVGRVVSEHKERYIVKTAEKEYEGEIIGNLRYSANQRSDFPVVGDWVAISEFDDNKVLIHVVFPRKNMIERRAIGKQGEKQIIASNIDHAFIVQAVDRDFNINRIERYLTICNSSNVKPVILLNKTDLVNDENLSDLINQVKARISDVPVIAISNETKKGIAELKGVIVKGKTYCLLGSSGVGKSTLLNTLSGENIARTDAVSLSTNKGRHITSHRELFILENGGVIIDNPGMREVGIADTSSGLETTFDKIFRLSRNCKFKDCSHTNETGCSVIEAVETGELDKSSYENYLKMEKEKAHFASTVAERRKKDREFGKMIKNYKKDKNKH